MERASLRPVPSRPPGPIDPAAAARHAAEALPGVDGAAAAALGLMALAGLPRPDAAKAVGLEAGELGDALARARKALRRAHQPLPGSGWCERAERLISDRLDDELDAPGGARLEVHLRNCARCVEHERRLVQATDILVEGFLESHPRPEPPMEAQQASVPGLEVLEPSERRVERREELAERPAPRPAPVPARRRTSALLWSLLFALAVALTAAAVALTALGVAGLNPL